MGGNLNTFRAASPRRSRTLAGAVWIMAATMVAAAAGGGAWAQDVPALRARAAALSAEAERVEDANDIKKLQRAYGYYLDKGYWGEAADLFADDATFEWGVDGVYVGKGRIREYLVRQGGGNVGPGLPYGQFNHHMQLQPVVNVAADGKTAKARWQELALIGQFQKFADWAAGVYENEYVKQDGVWKISHLRAPFNMYTSYKDGWGKVAIPHTRPDSFPPPPDYPPTVVSLTYPSFYVEPYHYPNPVTGKPMPRPNKAAGGVAPMLPEDGQ